MSGSFFDTNVLLYVAAALDTSKAQRAREILRSGGAISVQVLNEFANVARRKLKMEWSEISDVLGAVREGLVVHLLTVETHASSLRIAERHRLHIYDAMIVAAALEAGCDTLYSEDMHDGLRIDDRLTVVNPFG